MLPCELAVSRCMREREAVENIWRAYGEHIRRVRQLFTRFRNIRFGADNNFRHHPNMLLRGLEQLNITFDA